MRGFYCFHEYVVRVTEEKMKNYICSNINSSYFIDGLMNHIKVREEALPEFMAYLDNKIGIPYIFDDNYDAIKTVYDLFKDICRFMSMTNNDNLNDKDQVFKKHVKSNLIISHGEYYTLPTPVFSYTKPSSGVNFLLHIMLSLGKFDTEIDLMLHSSIRNSLRY
jgi:hypothetical protein